MWNFNGFPKYYINWLSSGKDSNVIPQKKTKNWERKKRIMNELNLVKNILSYGVIHKGNFLTSNNMSLLHMYESYLYE